MFCKRRHETVNEVECKHCWTHGGQKTAWLRHQMEQFGRRFRISRRECKIVNLHKERSK